MDQLPPETLIEIFKSFNEYTILTSLRPVCKTWAYASDIENPGRKVEGLPPALWENILSYCMDHRSLGMISQTCTSLRSLMKNTRLPELQGNSFQLPASSVPITPKPTSRIVQHPAFDSICCRIETGSLIYHKSGNCCPNDVLAFPVAEENATNPPVSKVLLKFTAKYGVNLRPVLITKPRHGKERGVTVGDIYKAMQRLFAEPLTPKQIFEIKQLRDWEARKHKKAREDLEKLESVPLPAATIPADYVIATQPETWAPLVAALPEKRPEIEHDDSEICLEYPFVADSLTNIHNVVRQQREFLYDFPYVYASAHVGGVVNGVQLFTLTYH